ncbi:hypothetical protein AC579_5315 [Pseudocercospora musae]|uniref:Uncharacterized protein n=1 Tax=Pseudocercospora musae TaxID=113226 RepID=A0A139HZJ0_9PEZI|nr:hypothetical protein AC579_5315 [Pseudocercospora musae]
MSQAMTDEGFEEDGAATPPPKDLPPEDTDMEDKGNIDEGAPPKRTPPPTVAQGLKNFDFEAARANAENEIELKGIEAMENEINGLPDRPKKASDAERMFVQGEDDNDDDEDEAQSQVASQAASQTQPEKAKT